MAIDTKHEDLQSLRIDRTQRGDSGGEPPAWARRYILGGVAVVVLLGVITLAYRAFSSDVPEVEVVRAAAETSRSKNGAPGQSPAPDRDRICQGQIHRSHPRSC